MYPADFTPFQDHLFLLDRDGTVVACRHALPAPKIGQNFFSVFQIEARERAELEEYLHGFAPRRIFFRAGGRTMLAYSTFYLRLGLYPILVPDEALFAHVDAPAITASSLPDAAFTTRITQRLRPPCEAEYRWFCDYLSPYQSALFPKLPWVESRTALIAVLLENQAKRIAKIAGCELIPDLDNIGFGRITNIDIEKYAGLVLLFCLLARSAAAQHTLCLSIEDCGTNGRICTLTASILPSKMEDLPDFLKYPTIRNAFRVYLDTKDGHLCIRFRLCVPALEKQGLKHPDIYPVGDFSLLPRPFPKEEEI